MADKTAAAPPQEGDWPPGYVPGQGFINQPEAQADSSAPEDPVAAAPVGGAPPPADASNEPSVDLKQLKMKRQFIDCPNCHEKHETKIKGRSEGSQKLHAFLWWPLKNRRWYFSKTFWYCSNCDYELAMQKYGKPLEVTGKKA